MHTKLFQPFPFIIITTTTYFYYSEGKGIICIYTHILPLLKISFNKLYLMNRVLCNTKPGIQGLRLTIWIGNLHTTEGYIIIRRGGEWKAFRIQYVWIMSHNNNKTRREILWRVSGHTNNRNVHITNDAKVIYTQVRIFFIYYIFVMLLEELSIKKSSH